MSHMVNGIAGWVVHSSASMSLIVARMRRVEVRIADGGAEGIRTPDSRIAPRFVIFLGNSHTVNSVDNVVHCNFYCNCLWLVYGVYRTLRIGLRASRFRT